MGWIKKWEIRGTRGDIYIVAIDENGEYGCSCPVWKFKRQKCKHIEKLLYITGGDIGLQTLPSEITQSAVSVTIQKLETRRAISFD